MTKAEFIAAIADESNFSKKEVATMCNAMEAVIEKTLANGESIRLVGFGTFTMTERKARKSINPHTGEVIKIPAKTVPKFKFGNYFKDKVAIVKKNGKKKK